jgi:hypothetical protein
MNFATLSEFFVILWSGSLDDTSMELLTFADGKQLTPLPFHGYGETYGMIKGSKTLEALEKSKLTL